MLYYIGKGALVGIPAGDLTKEEVDKAHSSLLALGLTDEEIEKQGGAAGALVNTGLYSKKQMKQKEAIPENKSLSGPANNKGGE